MGFYNEYFKVRFEAIDSKSSEIIYFSLYILIFYKCFDSEINFFLL